MKHHTLSFRRTLIAMLLSAGTVYAQTATRSTSPQTQPTTQLISPAAASHTAIDSGLAFLASQQNVDGSFQPAGSKLQTSGLALLAFLSAGDVPDSGRYGDAVRRVTEFLLRQTPGDRYFGRVDGSRLRGQAIVTLALCEVYGVESDEPTRIRLHATVKDAAAFLLAAQNSRLGTFGGWGTDPGAASDPAVTLWCLLALRAAQQIGLPVPQENLDRAAAYLQQNPLAGRDALLDNLYRNGDDTHFFGSPQWFSASRALLATQMPSGAWGAPGQSPGASSAAETAMNLFLLAAEDRLLPVWTK